MTILSGITARLNRGSIVNYLGSLKSHDRNQVIFEGVIPFLKWSELFLQSKWKIEVNGLISIYSNQDIIQRWTYSSWDSIWPPRTHPEHPSNHLNLHMARTTRGYVSNCREMLQWLPNFSAALVENVIPQKVISHESAPIRLINVLQWDWQYSKLYLKQKLKI